MIDGSRSRRARPADAMALVMDPERMRFSCDPYRNRMWKKASQLSTGVDSLLVSDAFHGAPSVDEWVVKLERVLRVGVDPEEIALKVQLVPKREPWEIVDLPAIELRSIVVRGVLGRCLSNHLASILQETSEPFLPSSAIAYRLENRDAVNEAILGVAAAIGLDGYRYWAKLDVRDCFNSMPRQAVARALAEFGYRSKFVKLVMSSVSAPRYRRLQGRLVKQDSDRGCPAGLPESSIVVNILCAPFDREMEQLFPGVLYRRYSDDFLFLGKTAAEVEAAVARLLRWIRSVGLSLRGVSPNQSARSLINDVYERSLVFLGAEIDQVGRIRVPTDVLEGQFAKVRYLLDRAAIHPELVAGRSRYARAGRRAAGIATYDLADIRASNDGFHRYWFDLDQGEATIFLARARQEFPMNPLSGAGPFQKLWVAALGDPVNLIGGGSEADQDVTADPLEGWFQAEVIPLIRDVISGTQQGFPGGIVGESGDFDFSGTSDPADEELCDQALHPWGRRTNEEPLPSWSTPGQGDPYGPPWTGSDVNELVGSANEACGLSAVPRGSANSRESSGNTAQGSASPPGEPRVPEMRLMLLAHEYDPVDETTRVQTDEFSDLGVPLGTWAMTFEGMPPETAVLDHLITRLRQTFGQRVVVGMRSAWLSKLLLQEGREPRSVGLFQRVRQLHRVGRRVAIVGPVRARDARGPVTAGAAVPD